MSAIHLVGTKKCRVVFVFDLPAGGDPMVMAQGILGSCSVGAGVVGALKQTAVQLIPADADPLTFNTNAN